MQQAAAVYTTGQHAHCLAVQDLLQADLRIQGCRWLRGCQRRRCLHNGILWRMLQHVLRLAVVRGLSRMQQGPCM